MNKIKSYYWYVGVPIAAVLLGTIVFFDVIVNTMRGNPHPQVNYMIFALIVIGCAMMWQQVLRMNTDAKRIEEFYQLAIKKPSIESLRAHIAKKHCDTDEVFEIVIDLMGKAVSRVQHAALESELDRYHRVQARHLILPQYMSGMMVGLGLLGTFIGLLGALSEISKLIGAFSIVNNGDPAAAIQVLVERLTSPMQAMGVAFSASLFGVMGSLVMGILLVGVRNCSGELNSLMDTRVTFLTDFSNDGNNTDDINGFSVAINTLAEQSPLLKALAGALDNSERRVRDLINAMTQVSSRLELNQAGNTSLINNLQSRLVSEDAIAKAMQATQDSLALIANRWSAAAQVETKIAALVQEQTLQSERFMVQLEASSELHQTLNERLVVSLIDAQSQHAASIKSFESLNMTMTHLSTETVDKITEVANAQVNSSNEMVNLIKAGFKDMANINRQSSDDFINITHKGFRDLFDAQRYVADETNKEVSAQLSHGYNLVASGQVEQAAMTHQIMRITDVLDSITSTNQAVIQRVIDQQQRNFEFSIREQSGAATQLLQAIQASGVSQSDIGNGLAHTLNDLTNAFRVDVEMRNLKLNHLELQIQSYFERQEEFVQTLLKFISTTHNPTNTNSVQA